MTMAFDTLRYAQRLQQVGVSREIGDDHVATKADLAAAVRDLRAEMKMLEQRMTIKLGAMLAGAIAIIVAAQKLL